MAHDALAWIRMLFEHWFFHLSSDFNQGLLQDATRFYYVIHISPSGAASKVLTLTAFPLMDDFCLLPSPG